MGLGNRHSQHSFAQIPAVNQARSVFDRSYAAKDTYAFDVLQPCYLEEILPGDTLNLNVKSFLRLNPQVVPLMDNVYIDWHFFFVPNRLVWNNWERFNGAQDDPGDSTDFLVPTVANVNTNPLFYHFGLPLANSEPVNALPFRAYNLIYNEWFRDQNLINSRPVPKGDGPDTPGDYVQQKRAKKHDYFTSALPWPQKGPAIEMDITGNIPITTNGINPTFSGGSIVNGTIYAADPVGGVSNVRSGLNPTAGTNPTLRFGNQSGLQGSSSDLGILINDFREAIMLQSVLELDARGGTRYTEILRAHFGVISPDARLQRPEYLSGGTTFLNQHPVAQTSETTAESPQGNLASFSTAGERGNAIGFNKSFVEHGFVIGLVSLRGDVTYQQGLNRMWSRRTRWDYFWPKLQELGEQAILNKEIYCQGAGVPADDLVFGYQERYAEYRYHPSEIRGNFRSGMPLPIDMWHLAQNFAALPALNQAFIESSTPIARNLSIAPDFNENDPVLADLWFDQKHVRPMQVYGVPATLGRF